MSFRAFVPVFKTLIFQIFFVCGIRKRANIVLQVDIKFSQNHLMKKTPSSFNANSIIFKSYFVMCMKVYFWIFNAISLICMCDFMSVHSILVTVSLL
jgi:hypothetical protein